MSDQKSAVRVAGVSLLCAVASLFVAPRSQAQDMAGTLKALDLYRAGNCADAAPLLETIVQHQPENLSLRKMLASCLIKTGKVAQGREQYKAVLQKQPSDLEARQALSPGEAPRVTVAPAGAPPIMGSPSLGPDFDAAEKLVRDHRLNEAEKALRAVITRLPHAALPQQRLAEIYSGTGRFAEAAAIYKALSAEKGSPSSYELRYAQNLAWGKQYTDSIAAYTLYVERNPKDAEGRLGLANAESWSGKTDESIAAYRQYLKMRPEDTEARTSLANALLKAGQYQDAVTEFLALQRKHPRDYKLQLALAEAYGHLGDTASSTAAYAKAADLPGGAASKGEASNVARSEAYARLENKDVDGAAKYFLEYLKQHPDSDETVLQVARAYSWGKHYSDAARYYADYLKRKPNDETALRESALVSMSIPDFASARRQYELLTPTPRATTADYEGLVHAYIWDGKFQEAQPYAKHLAQLDLNNGVADEAVKGLLSQQKQQALQKAREYTAASRYAEAIHEYKGFLALYGSDRETELTVCRLYSWNKQPNEAVASYEGYLKQYPGDLPARIELANVEKWDRRYAEARRQYEAVLKVDRKNPQALLGMAQLSDYQGLDAFGVLAEYKQALAVDASNGVIRDRANELLAQVSPSVGYTQKSFSDSDGFSRSSNTFEASFPLQGGLRLTPFYTIGYFHGYRQVDGTNCGSSTSTNYAIANLNSKICGNNGTFTGNTGGVKFQVANSRTVQLFGNLGYTRFASNNTMIEGRADLVVHPTADRILDIGYAHGSPIYDLNTVAVVAAGITGDTLSLSFQQPLADKWRLWTYAGLSRYSSGIDHLYTRNTQPRLSAKIDRQILPEFSAGYEMRVTGFGKETPLYFSPQLYQAYGLVYGWSHPLSKNFRLTADGNVDISRITRNNQSINSLEIAVVPALEWHVRPDLVFRLGYRFSRGSSSAVGSPVYSTGGVDFGLTKSLMQPLPEFDPGVLNVH